MIKIDLQIATKNKKIPTKSDFKKWVTHALKNRLDNVEICIRIVDTPEIIELNKTYRHKPQPTNILSFPYEINREFEKTPLLGDLVICADVMEAESIEYDIDPMVHWAHIVVHGILHLLGYDHIKLKDRKKMEGLEKEILNSLRY